jgi:hypothetical protein
MGGGATFFSNLVEVGRLERDQGKNGRGAEDGSP